MRSRDTEEHDIDTHDTHDTHHSSGRCEGKCVILDVGGDRFVASRKSLERFPSTRYLNASFIMEKDFKNTLQSELTSRPHATS